MRSKDNLYPEVKARKQAIEAARVMILTSDEKSVVREALYKVAEEYIEKARSRLKFDGKPMKGTAELIDWYFMRADILIAVASRIKI